MARYEKLRNNFYSMDIHYGKTNLLPYRDFICFFIVEHPNSKEFIRQEALQLLMSQCTHFEFYGAYSEEWGIGFSETGCMLHPSDDKAKIVLWEDIDLFAQSLELMLSQRPFVPFDIYLIYDDEETYRAILKKVEESQSRAMDLERILVLYEHLDDFLRKYGDDSTVQSRRIIKATTDCLKSEDNRAKKEEYVIYSYKALFSSKESLSEFNIWDSDFKTRKALNEPLDYIREELWLIMQEYV